MITRQRLIASMSSKTDWTEGGHAIWSASVDTDGYPRVYVGADQPLRNAVRVHYEIEHGVPVPDDMDLRNLCGNRCCLSHVEIVARGSAGGIAAAALAVDRPFRCGHERTPENTSPKYARADGGTSGGGCRMCHLAYQREYNRTRRGRTARS